MMSAKPFQSACRLLFGIVTCCSLGSASSSDTYRVLARVVSTDDITTTELGGFLTIYDATKTSDGVVYGVSGGGIVRFDGKSWKAVWNASDVALWTSIDYGSQAIWTSAIECWAAKVPENNSNPIPISLGKDCTINDLTVLDDGTVLVAGSDSSGRGTVLKLKNEEVSTYRLNDGQEFLSIESLGDDYIVLGGHDVIVVSDAATTTEYRDGLLGCLIVSIDILSRNDVWVSGKCRSSEDSMSAYRPAVFRILNQRLQIVDVQPGGAEVAIDIDMVDESFGWIVCDKFIIYQYDSGTWRIFADYRGLAVYERFNTVVTLGRNHAIFAGALSTVVEFRNGKMFPYLSQRARRSGFLLGDFGVVMRIDVQRDGAGWAVGEGGPPVRRLPGGSDWHPIDTVALSETIGAVTIGSDGNTWFGTSAGRGTGSSLIRYRETDYTVFNNVSDLTIFDIDTDENDVPWAIASMRDIVSGEKRSEILNLKNNSVNVVGKLNNRYMIAITVIGPDDVLVGGTGIMRCVSGVCGEISAEVGFVSNLYLSDDGVVYVAGSSGVGKYTGKGDVSRVNVDIKDDVLLAVGIHEGCGVVAGRRNVWTTDGASWKHHVIGSASEFGALSFYDAAVVRSHGVVNWWLSGEYNTIVSGMVTCVIEQTPTDVIPTWTAEATSPPAISTASTPPPVSRIAAFLPWAGR